MTAFRRFYRIASIVVGSLLTLSLFMVVSQAAIGKATLVFLGLAIPAAWMRVRFQPAAFLTLTTVLVFTAALLLDSPAPFIIATFSAAISALLIAQRPLGDALAEVAIEGIPALLLTILIGFSLPSGSLSIGEKVIAAAPSLVVFIAARFLLAAGWSYVSDGVRMRSFVAGPGRQILTNLLIFALEATALAFLATSFDRLGYLVPAIAVASLIEFYYPYKLLSDQEDAMYAGLAMIAQAIDAKDPYTARHSRNVADLAVRIAREIGLDESEVRKIRIGALLHDIGKVGVSGAIIRKPTSLEEHEGQAMRRHPTVGAEIMAPVEFLKEASRIVRHHHEHIDGSGYPDGLRGDEIPIGSRVILVADAFDAMTTDRPYRKGRSKEQAIRVLVEHAGRQFDEAVVKALASIQRSP